MSELRELYQEVILDHGRRPRNFGALQSANRHQEGYNPLCGDQIMLHVHEHDDRLQELTFEGCGCAISIASASLMTETLKGKSIPEVTEIFELFHQFVTVRHALSSVSQGKLGKLTVLGGVCEFPARVKCATLAWHTLKALLGEEMKVVSTE